MAASHPPTSVSAMAFRRAFACHALIGASFCIASYAGALSQHTSDMATAVAVFAVAGVLCAAANGFALAIAQVGAVEAYEAELDEDGIGLVVSSAAEA